MRLDLFELNQLPEVLNKEQLRKVGHMSKRTALFLLQSGLLPSKNTGKKTRCYQIMKKDVISFFEDYAKNPEKYMAPTNWYSEKKMITTGLIRLKPPKKISHEKLENYYSEQLADHIELFSVPEVMEFTGYSKSTIVSWITTGKLEALQLPTRFVVPKICLIRWLTSDEYNEIEKMSKKHLSTLWRLNT